ncbi:protein B4 [Rana temporaria]|uniref:protein B4 n=1 Tax=Rana temporaria TaxID=8407 RepID=UPI001AAD0636|nr:protein B4 [Rana temporaria]
MAPKKAAAASKDKEEVPAATETKAPKPTQMKTMGHPTTLAMVVEALKKDSERKGTSVPAIRARILAAHPTVDVVRLKGLLKAALNKGIEKGILVRPPNSSATGATGRFKLAKPLPKAKEGGKSTESENVDPNDQPKEKPKKEAVKKVKPTASKGEKVEAATKKEKPAEVKPKASKPKKDAEAPSKGPAAAKKPKAKKVDGEPKAKKVDGEPKAKKADGEPKSKKEPAKKEKAEAAEGPTKSLKDSEENGAAKASKKAKK